VYVQSDAYPPGTPHGSAAPLSTAVLLTFSVWTQFTMPIGERSEHPRGMPLVTRMAALQAEQRRETQQWHTSGVNSGRKTDIMRTTTDPDANPDTAEFMEMGTVQTTTTTR
jgi:hypothetical protein